MYKLLAISKTRYGTIYFAIVNEDGSTEAVAKCKDGICFAVTFIETTTSTYGSVIDFIRLQERLGLLKWKNLKFHKNNLMNFVVLEDYLL